MSAQGNLVTPPNHAICLPGTICQDEPNLNNQNPSVPSTNNPSTGNNANTNPATRTVVPPAATYPPAGASPSPNTSPATEASPVPPHTSANNSSSDPSALVLGLGIGLGLLAALLLLLLAWCCLRKRKTKKDDARPVIPYTWAPDKMMSSTEMADIQSNRMSFSGNRSAVLTAANVPITNDSANPAFTSLLAGTALAGLVSTTSTGEDEDENVYIRDLSDADLSAIYAVPENLGTPDFSEDFSFEKGTSPDKNLGIAPSTYVDTNATILPQQQPSPSAMYGLVGAGAAALLAGGAIAATHTVNDDTNKKPVVKHQQNFIEIPQNQPASSEFLTPIPDFNDIDKEQEIIAPRPISFTQTEQMSQLLESEDIPVYNEEPVLESTNREANNNYIAPAAAALGASALLTAPIILTSKDEEKEIYYNQLDQHLVQIVEEPIPEPRAVTPVQDESVNFIPIPVIAPVSSQVAEEIEDKAAIEEPTISIRALDEIPFEFIEKEVNEIKIEKEAVKAEIDPFVTLPVVSSDFLIDNTDTNTQDYSKKTDVAENSEREVDSSSVVVPVPVIIKYSSSEEKKVIKVEQPNIEAVPKEQENQYKSNEGSELTSTEPIQEEVTVEKEIISDSITVPVIDIVETTEQRTEVKSIEEPVKKEEPLIEAAPITITKVEESEIVNQVDKSGEVLEIQDDVKVIYPETVEQSVLGPTEELAPLKSVDEMTFEMTRDTVTKNEVNEDPIPISTDKISEQQAQSADVVAKHPEDIEKREENGKSRLGMAALFGAITAPVAAAVSALRKSDENDKKEGEEVDEPLLTKEEELVLEEIPVSEKPVEKQESIHQPFDAVPIVPVYAHLEGDGHMDAKVVKVDKSMGNKEKTVLPIEDYYVTVEQEEVQLEAPIVDVTPVISTNISEEEKELHIEPTTSELSDGKLMETNELPLMTANMEVNTPVSQSQQLLQSGSQESSKEIHIIERYVEVIERTIVVEKTHTETFIIDRTQTNEQNTFEVPIATIEESNREVPDVEQDEKQVLTDNIPIVLSPVPVEVDQKAAVDEETMDELENESPETIFRNDIEVDRIPTPTIRDTDLVITVIDDDKNVPDVSESAKRVFLEERKEIIFDEALPRDSSETLPVSQELVLVEEPDLQVEEKDVESFEVEKEVFESEEDFFPAEPESLNEVEFADANEDQHANDSNPITSYVVGGTTLAAGAAAFVVSSGKDEEKVNEQQEETSQQELVVEKELVIDNVKAPKEEETLSKQDDTPLAKKIKHDDVELVLPVVENVESTIEYQIVVSEVVSETTDADEPLVIPEEEPVDGMHIITEPIFEGTVERNAYKVKEPIEDEPTIEEVPSEDEINVLIQESNELFVYKEIIQIEETCEELAVKEGQLPETLKNETVPIEDVKAEEKEVEIDSAVLEQNGDDNLMETELAEEKEGESVQIEDDHSFEPLVETIEIVEPREQLKIDPVAQLHFHDEEYENKYIYIQEQAIDRTGEMIPKEIPFHNNEDGPLIEEVPDEQVSLPIVQESLVKQVEQVEEPVTPVEVQVPQSVQIVHEDNEMPKSKEVFQEELLLSQQTETEDSQGNPALVESAIEKTTLEMKEEDIYSNREEIPVFSKQDDDVEASEEAVIKADAVEALVVEEYVKEEPQDKKKPSFASILGGVAVAAIGGMTSLVASTFNSKDKEETEVERQNIEQEMVKEEEPKVEILTPTIVKEEPIVHVEKEVTSLDDTAIAYGLEKEEGSVLPVVPMKALELETDRNKNSDEIQDEEPFEASKNTQDVSIVVNQYHDNLDSKQSPSVDGVKDEYSDEESFSEVDVVEEDRVEISPLTRESAESIQSDNKATTSIEKVISILTTENNRTIVKSETIIHSNPNEQVSGSTVEYFAQSPISPQLDTTTSQSAVITKEVNSVNKKGVDDETTLNSKDSFVTMTSFKSAGNSEEDEISLEIPEVVRRLSKLKRVSHIDLVLFVKYLVLRWTEFNFEFFLEAIVAHADSIVNANTFVMVLQESGTSITKENLSYHFHHQVINIRLFSSELKSILHNLTTISVVEYIEKQLLLDHIILRRREFFMYNPNLVEDHAQNEDEQQLERDSLGDQSYSIEQVEEVQIEEQPKRTPQALQDDLEENQTTNVVSKRRSRRLSRDITTSSLLLRQKASRWSIKEDAISVISEPDSVYIENFFAQIKAYGPEAEFNLSNFIQACQERHGKFDIERFFKNLTSLYRPQDAEGQQKLTWLDLALALNGCGILCQTDDEVKSLMVNLCGNDSGVCLDILTQVVRSHHEGIVNLEFLLFYYFSFVEVSQTFAMKVRRLGKDVKFDLSGFVSACRRFNPDFTARLFLEKLSELDKPIESKNILALLYECHMEIDVGEYQEIMMALCGDISEHEHVISELIESIRDCGVDNFINLFAYNKSLIGQGFMTETEICMAIQLFYHEMFVLYPTSKFSLDSFFRTIDSFVQVNHEDVLYELVNVGNLKDDSSLGAALVAFGLSRTETEMCLESLAEDKSVARHVLKSWARLIGIIGIETYFFYGHAQFLQTNEIESTKTQAFVRILIQNILGLSKSSQFDVFLFVKAMRNHVPHYRFHQLLTNSTHLVVSRKEEWMSILFDGLVIDDEQERLGLISILFGKDKEVMMNALLLLGIYASLANPLEMEAWILACLRLRDEHVLLE